MEMILIPHNRAIEILQKRITDIDVWGADLEVCKTRTLIDVESIFGKFSTQWYAISNFSLLTYSGKKTTFDIKQSLKSNIYGFINYIKDFHIIEKEKVELSEKEFENKYSSLLERWNALVPEYNELLTNYQNLHKDHDTLLAEIKILQEKLGNKSPISENHKILFLGASPINEVRLRIDVEVRDIENGLKLTALRDKFELVQKWAVTTQTLQQAMLEIQPEIVHFSGHGDVSGIAIEDLLGNSKIIDNDALGSLFKLFSDSVKCVFLNSCYSETQATEIAKYIPYVIGMKSSVPDKVAIAFSTSFYAALGAGKDIGFAYQMGIVGIKLEGISGSNIPVLLG